MLWVRTARTTQLAASWVPLGLPHSTSLVGGAGATVPLSCLMGGPGAPSSVGRGCPHLHSTALLAEVTPFDPEEDELDGCESDTDPDTGTKEWWVLGEAGGEMQEGLRRGSPTTACSHHRTGVRVLSWLAHGFEKMLPQPEMLKNTEVSTAPSRGGDPGSL